VRRGPHRFNAGIDGLANRRGAGRKRRITEAERSRVIALACYAITSLTVTQATHAQLSAVTRGHRGIEDRLHRVFDMDFDEDRSQVLTASGPRIMASLRNLVITILRLAGGSQHHRRPALPRPAAQPTPTDDHEVLTDFAGALAGRSTVSNQPRPLNRG
jgi:predicted transposase YbfD/YdcC